MELINLYNIAEKENIDIDNYTWSNTKARIFEIDNQYSIAIDYSQLDNSIDEKEIVAEELGHYYCNALYYINSDKSLRNKCENRAMKWAYSILVPFQALKEKLTQGLTLYELADYFDVSIKYMINCIDFYVEKYGAIVK